MFPTNPLFYKSESMPIVNYEKAKEFCSVPGKKDPFEVWSTIISKDVSLNCNWDNPA